MNKDDREEIIKSLGRKGALKILDLLAEKKEMSFNEIARNVGYAVTANRVLKEFVKLGIVKKKEMKDKLGTVIYVLTENGLNINSLLVQMRMWE